jgi:uncharacterized protein YraI
MKTQFVFAFLIVALLILPWQTANAAGATLVAVVRSGGTDLLDAPGGSSVQSLGPGAVVTPTGRSADAAWVLVDTSDATGWIAAERLVIVTLDALPVVDAAAPATETAAPAATPKLSGPTPESVATPEASPPADPVVTPAGSVTGTVTTEDMRLNVRSGPGVSYTVIGKAAPGEALAVTAASRDGLWLRVARGDLPGGSGWVAAEYLALQGDVGQLPVADAEASAAVVTSVSAPATTSATGLSGTLVFQSSPGGTIYAYDLVSGVLRSLTHGFDPAISPDGTQVAFTRDGGEHGLYLIGIDGNNERLIFNGRDQLSSPKWNPDGSLILFVRGDEREECILVGGRCMQSAPSDGPGGAPGGGSFELPEDAVVTQMTLYKLALVDVNGGNYRDVPSLDTARAPDWTTSGIVYQSEAGMQRTADVPNAVSELIITDPLKPYFDDPAQQPRPEGSRGLIAYQGKEASHTEIFVVNQDGSGVTALTRPQTTLVDELPSNVAPAWSPDGQQIVFLSNREENGEAGTWRLWVMDADGSNQRRLPIDVALTYTYGAEQAVSWGPSAATLAAQ